MLTRHPAANRTSQASARGAGIARANRKLPGYLVPALSNNRKLSLGILYPHSPIGSSPWVSCTRTLQSEALPGYRASQRAARARLERAVASHSVWFALF
eukprot:3742307-Pyramimonas_sp.AAC.1